MLLKLISILLMGAAITGAQNKDGLQLKTVSITSNIRSKYIFSTAANLYNDPVVQTELFTLTKSGAFFDVWNSLPLDIKTAGDNFGTELYVSAGWLGKVGDYNLVIAAGYEDLYRTLSPEGSDFLIFSTEVSRDFAPSTNLTLTPFGKIEFNFTPDGSTMGTPLTRVGLRYSYKLHECVSLAGKTQVVHDPGLLGADMAFVGNVDAALLWKLGKHAVIELPYIRYVSPINRVNDGRKGDIVYGCGLSYVF
jgi:hypothetical protein